MNNLCMLMIFQIEATSLKTKENMKNKIQKELENVLEKANIFLEYDKETNSFAYMEEDVKESFDKKAIFLLKTLQHFGYAYVVTGNLKLREFDICPLKQR